MSLAETDLFDVRRATSATGLLHDFNAAGVLDAAEIPPTYGISQDRFVAQINIAEWQSSTITPGPTGGAERLLKSGRDIIARLSPP